LSAQPRSAAIAHCPRRVAKKASVKILLVTQFYAPEPNAKAPGLARGLMDRGHEVEVLTTYPSYPVGRTYEGYKQRPWTREIIDGIPVIRVASFPDHGHSAVLRFASYASFAATATGVGGFLVTRANVVWGYQPPPTTSYAALAVAKSHRTPFVLEIQDMWPDTLVATGVAKAPVLIGAIEKAMRFLYRQSAAISVISPGFKANLIAKGVAAAKIHVIPNWDLGMSKAPMPADPGIADAEGLSGRFNIIFAGVMGPAQALHHVIDAAAQLQDMPLIQFVFIGDGVDEPRLQSIAKQRGLENVRFLGRRPESDMPGLFAHASALLVHLKDDPLFRITIPSKTLSYLASGRPIISATAGDPAAVVEESGAGLTCNPSDPGALAEAVRRFSRLSSDEREAMALAARRSYLSRYSREVLIGRYEALFEQVGRAGK
jgi:colanic acid biosynthesis glycosyl transferase WcaI